MILEMKKGIKKIQRKGVISFFLLIYLFSCGVVSSLADTKQEYAVKAAFVLNFAKFTQWPEEAFENPDSFSLCVIGGKSLTEGFQTIDGKKVDDRSLRVDFVSEADDFDKCNMLFVGKDIDRSALLRIFASVTEKPVLTIGEVKDFAMLGGVINFVRKKGKLRFEVNRDTSLKQKIQISSRLLKLAIIVNGEK